jgi:outer membrane immunogenic protein
VKAAHSGNLHPIEHGGIMRPKAELTGKAIPGIKPGMKGRILLVAIIGLATGLHPATGGPEPLPGKESKAVVQPPPPECNWTGFYIGVHAGYAWGDASFNEDFESDPSFNFDRAGFMGGGQIGFNWQLGRWFVIGAEGTFSGWDGNDSTTIHHSGESTNGDFNDSDWIATAGGRVGISFLRNRLLAYVKGGAAWTQWGFTTHEVGGDESFHLDNDNTSGFVGTGLEYAFTCHWSVGVEWNHIFLDDSGDRIGIETVGSSRNERMWQINVDDIDTVTARLNFKF